MEVNDIKLLQETLQAHTEQLAEHRNEINALKEAHEQFEETQEKHAEKITTINENYVKLENTIFRESKETRDMMRGIFEKQSELISSLTGYKESSSARETELTKFRVEKRSDIWVKMIGWGTIATGSGGFLYAIIQAFLNTK